MKSHRLGPCKSKYLLGYLSQSTDIKGEADVLPCITFSLIQEGNSCVSVLSCILAWINGHTRHTRICPFSDCIVCRLNGSEVFALFGNCFRYAFPGKPWTLSPQKIKVQKAVFPSTISLPSQTWTLFTAPSRMALTKTWVTPNVCIFFPSLTGYSFQSYWVLAVLWPK